LWGALVRLVEGPRAEPQDGNAKRAREAEKAQKDR